MALYILVNFELTKNEHLLENVGETILSYLNNLRRNLLEYP